MNLIRSRFCDEADRTRRFATTCSSRGAGLDFELLQGIGKWRGHIPVSLGVIVECSIQSETHPAVQPARDRKGRLVEGIPGGSVGNWGRCGCSSQCDQLHRLPTIQWKFKDSCVLHYLADARAPCFHQGRVGLDLYRLRDLAYLQSYVNHRIAVHLQHNSGLGIGTESR